MADIEPGQGGIAPIPRQQVWPSPVSPHDVTVVNPERQSAAGRVQSPAAAATTPSAPAGPEPAATITRAPTGSAATPTPGDATHSPPPKMLGRYQVISEIGRGGMGVVYCALDTQVQRTVALKVMLADDPDQEAVQRFLREGRIAARLHHPNIVPVYDLGRADGKLYFTMEWIDGESLAKVLERMGRLSQRAALRIGRDVARALAHAHGENCIHRDIKPSNVIVTSIGAVASAGHEERETRLQLGKSDTSSFRILVTDFGLAKDLVSEPRMTRTGVIMGTPAYMSPEQIDGAPDRIGPPTDQYALGVLMYELLTGDIPFSAEDPMKILQMAMTSDPPPVRSHVRDVHPDVETIVARAMEKDPARRYPGCGELADDIDRYLRGEPIQARPVGRLTRLWRRLQRNRPLLYTLITALAVLAVQTAYFAVWPKVRAAREARRLAEERATREAEARRGLEEAEAALASGNADDAGERGRRLLEQWRDAGGRGEDVRLPQIHDLLARVHASRQEPRAALLERYRSYRAALDRGEHGEFLLRAARELVEQGQPEEALLLLLQHPEDSTDSGDLRTRRAYWHGRALEGIMDFRGAARLLEVALADPDLPADLRAECGAHRDFCRAFARDAEDPLAGRRMAAWDVDGDGKPEAAVQEQADLVLGRLTEGRFVEIARAPVGLAGEWNAWPLTGLDAPGLLVATRSGDPGSARLVAFRSGKLEPGGSLDRLGTISDVVAFDNDGDGAREIVLSDRDRRTVWLAACEDGGRRLRPIGASSGPSTLFVLATLDLDGDGREEMVGAFGPWGGYGVRSLRFDLQRGLVPVRQVEIGICYSMVVVDRPDRPRAVAVAVRWRAGSFVQMETIWGPEAFRKRFRPAGVYLVEGSPDGSLAASPVLAAEGAAEFATEGRLVSVRTRGGQFLFCKAGTPVTTVVRADAPGRPFAKLVASRLPGAPGAELERATDLDGDGFDELVLLADAGRPSRLLGAEPGDLGPATADAVRSTIAPGATRARPALHEYANACARVGLDEEAAAAYQETVERATGLADTEEALSARVSCLARLGKPEEVVRAVADVGKRFPAAVTQVARVAVRELDERRWWPQAAEVAATLATRVDLSAAERARYNEEARRFRALADPPRRIVLVGANAARLDWLASSPFAATIGEDGCWILWASGNFPGRVAVPLGGRWESWRMDARATASEQGWGTCVRFGLLPPVTRLLSDPPAHALEFGCGAASAAPTYSVQVLSERNRQTLFEGRTLWGERPLALRLAGTARHGTLTATLEGAEGREAAIVQTLPAPTPGDPVWVGAESTAQQNPLLWAVVRVESWEISWTADGAQPLAFRPVTALDHLLLANGRWITGRREEAAGLYDAAVVLADLEQARDAGAQSAGLPAAAERWGPNPDAAMLPVDARFCRGLLRAVQGDPAGAQSDLHAAWKLCAERVKALVQSLARPLLAGRDRELAALRAFWSAREGRPPGGSIQEQVLPTLQALGPWATSVLHSGFRPMKRLQIIHVFPDGTWATTGLRDSDFLAALDGQPIAGLADLRARLREAESAGRPTVRLAVIRGDQGFEVTAPPRVEGVEILECVPGVEGE